MELAQVLKEKYPKLNYKIFLILCCPSCYDINQDLKLHDSNIVIINNSKNVNVQLQDDNLCNCIVNNVIPLIK